MNWEQTLAATGMAEAELSGAIKKEIDKYRKLLQGFQDAQTTSKRRGLSEEQKAGLKIQVDDLQMALDNQNDVLVRKINDWHKNKDIYMARTASLQASRQKKGQKPAAETQQKPAIEVAPTLSTEPVVTVTLQGEGGIPPATVTENPIVPIVVAPPAEPAPEPKKEKDGKEGGGDGIWWAVGISAIALLTFGAVRLSKRA